MWYVVIAVAAAVLIYVYRTIFTSSGSQFEDNSLDAFILSDDDVACVSSNDATDADRYSRSYDVEGYPVLILYGTEYGFSEEVAKILFDRILEKAQTGKWNHQPRLVNCRDYACIDLNSEKWMFVVISTSGDGVPPSESRPFFEYLSQYKHPLVSLQFSVLALGDSNYPLFCKAGKMLQERLCDLNADSVLDLHEVDQEDWSVIYSWMVKVVNYLEEYIDKHNIQPWLDYLTMPLGGADQGYNRHRPFLSKLKVKRNLTIGDSSDDKETIHCEFDITGSDLTWTSGDALGIYPLNNPREVARLLSAMKCTGTEEVQTPSWAYTDVQSAKNDMVDLQLALTKYYDLKNVKPDLLIEVKRNVVDTDQCQMLDALLEKGVSKSNNILHEYLAEREVCDILSQFSHHTLDHNKLLKCLKALQPRYYSISSSPLVDSNTVCVTAAVLRYLSLGLDRTGVTTTFLQDRLPLNQTCPVFMSRNPDFRLPSNPSLPIILIGPGTGIAPFRAFIQEKELQENPGVTLLYFGCRHKSRDFLYQEELDNWHNKKLIRLRVAFSRDQERKVYVQDLLYQDRDLLWDLIDKDGAYVYVCGDAKHMAHDVHKTLLNIAQGQGHLTETEAVSYFQNLETQARYQKDVWVT